MAFIQRKKRAYRANSRDKERQTVYNTRRWRELRLMKLRFDPLCESCLAKGDITPGEDVHHKISFLSTDDPFERQALAWDFDNLMTLCKLCHAEIHNKGNH